MRRPIAWAAAAVLAAAVRPAGAQTFDRVSLATTFSIDQLGGENAADRPNIVADIMGTVRLGAGWEIYVRPWLRQGRRPDWDTLLYQAALRWEHSGPLAWRLDTGYIVSPVGLGLFDSSPSVNPTILPHLSYFVPLAEVDVTAPRMPAIASSYPLGVELTASTERWDARAALVNSAPTRLYTVGSDALPRSTPVVEGGAGITPTAGLRLGASIAHGAYATRDEVRAFPDAERTLTMVGVEGEYAFRYTKLSGELVRDHFTTPFGPAVAHAWFVQAQQTLTPRWFAAARQERVSAPPLANGIVVGTRSHLMLTEATVGYRVTRGIAIRGGYYARKNYGAASWDHQGCVSLVWTQRWR
jgi:hypothetical protein